MYIPRGVLNLRIASSSVRKITQRHTHGLVHCYTKVHHNTLTNKLAHTLDNTLNDDEAEYAIKLVSQHIQ